MKYTSTRGTATVGNLCVVKRIGGPDGGLYVPAVFPERCLTYDMLADKSYQELAFIVLSKFFPNFSEAELKDMINMRLFQGEF